MDFLEEIEGLSGIANHGRTISVKDLVPFIGLGIIGVAGVTVFGYFWSGRKSADEIRAERKVKADKAKSERAQKQQMLQQLQGGGGDMSQFAPPNVDSNELSRINEFQKNLSYILQAANVQYSKGQYDKALQLYQEGLKLIPPNIPQYDNFALEITPKLVTCYLETNKVREANDFLMNLKPLLSKNPETVLSLNVIRAQVLDALNSDVELEKLLLENIDASQRIFGSNSVKYINQLYSYGTFLVKKQKYRQAIERFQLCLEFHSSTGVAPSQEEFGIYRQIQRCHLLLDEKDEALRLLERIKLLTEDPITVAWQMHHTATLLLETNFNDDAEELFQEILADFPVPPKGEFEVPRIKSLVSNTVSEYAMFLFNAGRTSEAERYLELIKLYKWGVLSSSVYLVAKMANIYFAPKGNASDGFIAKINCEFILTKRVKKGMVIDFDTEIEGKDSASIEIEQGQISAKFSGKEVTKIENKIYTVTAKVYSDKSRSELLFTHYQFVPSSIDTRNMKTWKDIEEGFKAAKKV